MKIKIIRFLINIKNNLHRQVINLFIQDIGILKRDLIQNVCPDVYQGIGATSWRCIAFMMNKINKKTNAECIKLESLNQLTEQNTNQIIYDMELCTYNYTTLLCIFFLPENGIYNTMFIIDIVNLFMIIINDQKVHITYLGNRPVKKYTETYKIYSVIMNAILYKHYKEYQQHEDAKKLSNLFRPLYEMLGIQQG